MAPGEGPPTGGCDDLVLYVYGLPSPTSCVSAAQPLLLLCTPLCMFWSNSPPASHRDRG